MDDIATGSAQMRTVTAARHLRTHEVCVFPQSTAKIE
jgi:hypothetical protein